MPDLDDEFAKDVDEDVDTLDELKAKLRDQLKQDKDQKADDAIQESAVNQAVANATIADLPEVMIDSEVHNQMGNRCCYGRSDLEGFSGEECMRCGGRKEYERDQRRRLE